MSSLYLKHVEISDFRVYGRSYGFNFPGEPSIIIITGANGVGKTTFFDALEWGLTGKVSRFDDVLSDGRRRKKDPLTRLGQPDGSHFVSLQYTDGQPIDRGAGVVPDQEKISRFLKRTDWPDISDLERYLSITHFLGQASSQRFSVRKPKDQWEALKGPAGVDRINFVKERIGNQSARLAFNRRIKEATERVELAEASLTAWTQLLLDRDKLQQLSTSENAMGPAEVVSASNEVGRRLSDLSDSAKWQDAASSEPPEATLGRLAAYSNSIRGLLDAGAANIGLLERSVSDFERINTEQVAINNVVTTIGPKRDQAQRSLTQIETDYATQADGLATLQRQASEASSQIASISRLRSAYDTLSVAVRDLEGLNKELAANQKSRAALESRRAELTSQLTDAASRLGRRTALAERLAQAKVRADIAGRIESINPEISRLRSLASEDKVEALRGTQMSTQRERDSALVIMGRLSAEIQQHGDRQAQINEALALLAAQVGHDETTCPVCLTEFAPGHLERLLKSPREAHSADELGSRLAEVHIQVQGFDKILSDTALSLANLLRLQGELQRYQSETEALTQRLAQAGGTVSGIITRANELALITSLETEIGQFDQESALAPTMDELQGLIDEINVSLKAETTRQTGLQRRIAEASAKTKSTRASLRQFPDMWDETKGLLVSMSDADASAQEAANSLGAALGKAQSTLGELSLRREGMRQQLAQDTATLEAAKRKLNELVKAKQACISAWVDAGMAGEPLRSQVDEERSRAADRSETFLRLNERVARIRDGLRRWSQDQQLREKQNSIQDRIKELKAADESDVRPMLIAILANSQNALSKSQSARAQMETVVSNLQGQADTYAELVLQPLNKTIQRFGRALMTWSDASIVYKAEHLAARSELRPNAIRTDTAGRVSTLEINPNLYFSEGQLSALSVSALFAASTSFQWSRWRGLLLDDPLQHNDIIHASAFMDLLRQLVRCLGYQVILSTHDSSEAEFLVRKCQSAKVPFMVHQLAPHGEEGLVSAVA